APDATPLVIPKAAALGNDFTALAKKLEPSVVNLTVEVSGNNANSAISGLFDDDEDNDSSDLLRRFFGQGGPGGSGQRGQRANPTPQQMPRRSQSGTGFIVDRNGYLITNNHVVKGAEKIRIKVDNDPTEYRGRVIGTDEETDLAVVKIESRKQFTPVNIGN